MMKIAFFGDSVTEGCFALYTTSYGFDTVREPEHVYHALLKPMLERRLGQSVEIVNAGISGDNSHRAVERLQADVIDRHPDACVVCFGLNDCLHDPALYAKSMDRIFGALREAGIPALFMTPNMMNTYVHPETLESAKKIAATTAEYQKSGRFDALLDLGREAAVKNGAGIVDFYALWKAKAEAGEDTTELLINRINHPDREMHRAAAEMLLEPLCALLEA